MERFLIKFSFYVAIALVQIHGSNSCLEQERIALLEIKDFIKSVSDKQDSDRILVSWVDDKMSDCCGWERVKCNATTGGVMKISLNSTWQFTSQASSNGFFILNSSLFIPFEELQSLDLSQNSFNKAYGSFGSSKRLKMLNLGGNFFDGSIFPLLTSLTSLTTLICNDNAMEGFRPKQGLSNLSNLEMLDLSGNGIRGSLTRLGLCELQNLLELDLSGNHFDGDLPQCLSNLTKLQLLDLSSNQLSGNPSVIGKLTSLKCLSLVKNSFDGSFTFSSLANHTNLEIFQLSTQSNMLYVETESSALLPTFKLKVLYLRNCNLNVFPSFLLYQNGLKYIDLSHNKLEGTFPTWLLRNNTKLEMLYLNNNSFKGFLQLPNFEHGLLRLEISNNNFNGQLPENVGTILPKLLSVNMSMNNFQGYIPSTMGDIKSLDMLDLSSNNLSGELSRNFLTGCFSLTFLGLSDNNFKGQIFPQYMNLTQLTWLYLDNNNFSGKLGEGLSKARFLWVLDISNNMVSGQIPDWIGNFSTVSVLLMSKNLLQGNIPIQLGSLQSLSTLDISENMLFGSIVSSFNLSLLQHLYMQKNDFSGSIQNILLRSFELLTLDLRDNKFSGSIPNMIGELSVLRALLLGRNHLQGHIPIQLCQLRKLRFLDLSHNRFNGSIPSCFNNMLFWTVAIQDNYQYGFMTRYTYSEESDYIGTYYNSTGVDLTQVVEFYTADDPIEVEFMTKNRHESYKGDILNYMSGLDLSSNELVGDIPIELGNLGEIHALNLSHNSLSGCIPENFSHLKMIESLDLSYNKLSSRIPAQLAMLNYLAIFNVSYNSLSGPIPNQGQFANFDENNYGGNPDLCGLQIRKSCNDKVALPSSPFNVVDEEKEESVIDMVVFYWSLAASYVTIIVGLVVILWINSYWRRRWFCFIDTCIDSCFYWFSKYVFQQ